MDARAKSVREILLSGDQYLIPFFQRSYSWDKKNWKRLLDDIEMLIAESSRSQHFLGPLVCTPGEHVPGEVNAYQLIDGQQRLTTLSVLFIALRDVALELGLKDLSEEVEEDYLIHKRRAGTQRFKIVPRLGDREILGALIDRKELPATGDASLNRAYRFMRKRLSEIASEQPEKLRAMLAAAADRLSLVVITITGENPYEIFESLNSTGLPLEESDLIRNFIFMEVPIADQDDFNREWWQPFESLLTTKVDGAGLNSTAFYRDYLMRRGQYVKQRSTYIAFKDQVRDTKVLPISQVHELRRHLKYSRQIQRMEDHPVSALNEALTDLHELEVSTANPLLLSLLERFDEKSLSAEELHGCLRDLASFVLRRGMCGYSTRTYGQWFVSAIELLKTSPRENLQAYFSDRGWPNDLSFESALAKFDLYRREPVKCRLILQRLELSYGHKERVDPSTLTIEHVLAQKPNEEARNELKSLLAQPDNWYPIQQQWLHTIGNLTLTGYNRELSNRPFFVKRPELLRSNLVLNRYFSDVDSWGPEQIRARGNALANQVAVLWPNPVPLPDDPADTPRRGRDSSFDISGLREASIARINQIFGVQFQPEGEARFIAVSGSDRLVCAGSQPYDAGATTSYWFGITPEQVAFLKASSPRHVAFACGSPDRILIFGVEEFEALSKGMNVTEGRHWHVQVEWGEQVFVEQPKQNERKDVSHAILRE